MAPGRLTRIRGSLSDAYSDGGARGVTKMLADYMRWRTGIAVGDPAAAADTRKHRANVRHIEGLADTPWMGMVRQAQDEITASHPDEYWAVYRPQEVGYWTDVARWLYERSSEETWSRSLDVGCGYGTLAVLLSLLSDGEVCCMDMLESRFTDELARSKNLHFARSNIELDPIPWDHSFDVIVFTEVLEHLNFYPVPTLLKLRNALKPGGRLFLSTPDAAEWGRVTTYYQSIDEMPTPEEAMPRIARGEWGYVDAHVWQYDEHELARVISEAGFAVVREALAPGVVHRHFNLELAPA